MSLAQESLAEKAADALSDEILSGRLQPGERVDLNYYSSIWKISITPLRDATKNLQSTGLLRVLPRRGVFVTELSAKALKDIFDVRVALECMAIHLATPRIPAAEARRTLDLYIKARDAASAQERRRALAQSDLLIHGLAQQYCDNIRLQKLMEEMRDLITWSQRTIVAKLKEPFATTLPEHIAICEAVLAGDAGLAAERMRIHLENALARTLAFLAAQGSRLPAGPTAGAGSGRDSLNGGPKRQ